METGTRYVERFGLDKLLSPDLLALLTPSCREGGELVIRAGDPSDRLYFLVEGRTKAYCALENGQSVLASFMIPLDILGEVELFYGDRYTLSVEALLPSVFLSLPSQAVKAAAERNVALLAFVCGRLGEKVAYRNVVDSINLRYPVENRLASYLVASSDDEGRVLGTGNLGQIADFIGSSYRQLERVARRFRDEGILAAGRGDLRIRDRRRLEGLARDLYLPGPAFRGR